MDLTTPVGLASVPVAIAAAAFAYQSAREARAQTRLQREIREDAAQPRVWVDIRPDPSQGTLLQFVVGNDGPTVARNIRVTVSPRIPSTEQFRATAKLLEGLFGQGLSSLAPGRELRWGLGQGFNILDGSDELALMLTIDADGPYGPLPTSSYPLDLREWSSSLDQPAGSLYQTTKALEEIASELKRTKR